MQPDRDESAPADTTRRRPSWSWKQLAKIATAIGGVISLVVAVGAWLQPDLPGWICDVSQNRAIGCNKVPDDFLGRWTGPEKCHGDGLTIDCVTDEAPVTLVIGRGRLNQKAVVTSTSDTCEVSWRLLSAKKNVLELRTEESRPVTLGKVDNPEYPGAPTGCPTGLSVTLRLNPADHTLQSQLRTGENPPVLVAPNVVLFTATLQKQ
jgi:hypothetical protein